VVVSRKQAKGEEKRGGRPPDLNRLRENLLKEQLGKVGRREREPDSDSDYPDRRRGYEEGRTSRYGDDGGRQWQEKRGGNGNWFSEQGVSEQRGAGYAERRGGNGAWQEEDQGRGTERAPYGVNRRGGAGRYGRGSFGRGSYGRGRGSRYGSGREDDYRDDGRYRQGGESRLERGGRGPWRGYQVRGRGPQGGSRGRGLAPVADRVGMDRRQTALSFSDDEEYEEGDSDYEEEDDDELPPDTFVMKDAQGDDVVVIGHEDLDPKQLSPDVLTWTPIKVKRF
jgi:16S rRNA (cytosine967-C5)-methyltransferase